MKISGVDALEIFWFESRGYIFTYLAYAMVVGAAITAIESKIQLSGITTPKIVFANMIFCFFATVLMATSMFIIGWKSQILGGEILAFSIVTIVSIGALLLVKIALQNYLKIQFGHPFILYSAYALVLMVPFIIFHVFVFLLGSAWKN